MVEYVGAIHIHSTYSDGSGTVDEIIKAAQEVGLDYIVLTDHNTMRARKEGKEGWHDKTFLLVGAELNDKRNLNHYLALGIDKTFSTRISAKEYVAKVKELFLFCFIEHDQEDLFCM
jgi:predicted metal-dependent phosphoesterase TrpH